MTAIDGGQVASRALTALVPDLPRPTEQDFAQARIYLDAFFETVDDLVWDKLEQLIRAADWPTAHLVAVVDKLLVTKTWILAGDSRPRWTPGDFFREGVPQVYNHAWYTEQITPPKGRKSNADLLGCYHVPGYKRPVFGWKAEVGTALELWSVERHAVPELPEHREPLSEETRATIAEAVESARQQEEVKRRTADLETENRRVQQENAGLRHDREMLTIQVEEQKEYIAELERRWREFEAIIDELQEEA